LTGYANAKDRIAKIKICDAFTDGAGYAGIISAQGKWKLRLLVLADALLPIGAVNAGGNHFDDHFARSGDRIWQIDVLQDFGPAILFNECGLDYVFAFLIRGERVVCQTERSPDGTPSLQSGNGRILKISATEQF
jgi:hypothetical protein